MCFPSVCKHQQETKLHLELVNTFESFLNVIKYPPIHLYAQTQTYIMKHPCNCCVLNRSFATLVNCSPPGSSVHRDSPGKNTRVCCHALLRGIFPTQGLNPGLLNCRRILYHLSHQRSQWNYYADTTDMTFKNK